jgi:hypothetical protein
MNEEILRDQDIPSYSMLGLSKFGRTFSRL